MALVRDWDVQSSVDLEENQGDDQARDLELSWTLRVVDRTGGVRSSRREEHVKCRVEKRGRKWKIVLFEPMALFAPVGEPAATGHE